MAGPNGCLICDQVAVVETLPGGALVDTDDVVAYHVPPIDRFPRQYLGRVLLVTRRHVDRLGELTENEAVAVGTTARLIARGLEAMDDVLRVHLALIGLHVPHFHLHVFPRYAWLPRDVDMNALHTLPDAPRGAAAEITAFAERLRRHL